MMALLYFGIHLESLLEKVSPKKSIHIKHILTSTCHFYDRIKSFNKFLEINNKEFLFYTIIPNEVMAN